MLRQPSPRWDQTGRRSPALASACSQPAPVQSSNPWGDLPWAGWTWAGHCHSYQWRRRGACVALTASQSQPGWKREVGQGCSYPVRTNGWSKLTQQTQHPAASLWAIPCATTHHHRTRGLLTHPTSNSNTSLAAPRWPTQHRRSNSFTSFLAKRQEASTVWHHIKSIHTPAVSGGHVLTCVSAGGSSAKARLLLRYLSLSFLSIL